MINMQIKLKVVVKFYINGTSVLGQAKIYDGDTNVHRNSERYEESIF